MPTREEILNELQRRHAQPGSLSPRQKEVAQELRRRFEGKSPLHRLLEWGPGGELLQAAPILPGRMALPAEELAPPLMGEMGGQLQTRGTLPALAEFGAGMVTPGAAKPFVAAGAAGVGEAIEEVLHGERLDPKKIGLEAGLSFLPELGESAARWGIRWLVRGTEGAKQIRWSEAARRARETFPAIYNPPTRQAVDRSFEALRKAGVSVDVSDFAGAIQDLTDGKFDDLLGEVRRIDRRLKTGGRYTEAIQATRRGEPLTLDVGDLQTFRSELRKRAGEMAPVEAQQLLRDVQFDVDDAVDTALAREGMPGLAQQARRDYARLKASEEMVDLVERKITSAPDLSSVQFNLRAFYDDLRRSQTRQARQINRALDYTPGARAAMEREIDDLSKLFRKIELPVADVSRGRRWALVAALGGWLSDIMLTQLGRDLFHQTVIQGRGRISPNALAAIASVARREYRGESSPLQQGATLQIGRAAPGGNAPSGQ